MFNVLTHARLYCITVKTVYRSALARDYSSVLLYIDTVLTTYACNFIVFLAVKSRFFDNDIERPLSPE